MIPKEIERQHIQKALRELDRDGILPNREATKYQLEYRGKEYPPKEVLRVAARYATGKELLYGYSGGKMANEFLQKRGFTVREISAWSKKDCYVAVWAYDQLDIVSSTRKSELIAEVARIVDRSENSVKWKIQEVASLDSRPDDEKPVTETREPKAPLVEVFNWYWKDREFARSIYNHDKETEVLNAEYPIFELVKERRVSLVATSQIDPETDYLRVLENWEADQIAQPGFDAVQSITNSERRSSKGRLAIRLAILQAFSDLGSRELTVSDFEDYWSNHVPKRLNHPKAHNLPNEHRQVLTDITAMAGFDAPRLKAHPRPPIRLVFPDGRLIESTPNSGETSPVQFIDELERIESDLKWIDRPTEKEAVVKVRIQQGKFREALRKLWNDRCAVSDIENSRLLLASHIKPWSRCNNSEKLDPNNGLLLSPLLDRLFDQGLITFNETGNIQFSRELIESDQDKMGLTAELNLRKKMTEEMKNYMRYHREFIFKSEPPT